jgi:hypothetical protein
MIIISATLFSISGVRYILWDVYIELPYATVIIPFCIKKKKKWVVTSKLKSDTRNVILAIRSTLSPIVFR